MATTEQTLKFEAPSRLATWLELRAPIDWASILLRAPQLARASRGDGRPVMLLPGYGTDHHSMRPLGGYLNYLGYDVYDWGLGRNRGDVDGDMVRVGERARELHDELGGVSVTLIGWSLAKRRGCSSLMSGRSLRSERRLLVDRSTPLPLTGLRRSPISISTNSRGKLTKEIPLESVSP